MKNLPSRWKYGLVATIAVLGISSVASYYAGATHPLVARPQTSSVDEQVKGAEAPTLTPTATLAPTTTPTATLIPTRIYIAPTTPYIPPTQEPASQTNGNQVHSPTNSTYGSVPSGATAQCADGTYSFSQHHSGTCSHHGGVAQWL
jgi:hypothetical protein